MKSKTFLLSVVLPLGVLVALLVLIAGCEKPPEQGHQGGCQRPRCWPSPLPGVPLASERSRP